MKEKPIILKHYYYFLRLTHSKVLASFLAYGAILVIYAGFVSFRIHRNLISFNLGLIILWISLAPFLIDTALNIVSNFFSDNQHIFQKPKAMKVQRTKELHAIASTKNNLLGIPLGLLFGFVGYYTFRTDDLYSNVFYFAVFFTMAFLANIGLLGIYRAATMFSRLKNLDLNFNPGHPDQFGGYKNLGNFVVKATLLFSTGSLALPIAFEMATSHSNNTYNVMTIVGLIVGFIAVDIICFIKPILSIMAIVNPFIDDYTGRVFESYHRMFEDYLLETELDIKRLSDLYMYERIKVRQVRDFKKYPYDTQVLFEFLVSILIPVVLTVIGLVLG